MVQVVQGPALYAAGFDIWFDFSGTHLVLNFIWKFDQFVWLPYFWVIAFSGLILYYIFPIQMALFLWLIGYCSLWLFLSVNIWFGLEFEYQFHC